MKRSKQAKTMAPKGAIVAEAFALRGAKAAAEVAARLGRDGLAEKIRRGQFAAPSGPFNAARAQARAAALRALA